MNKVEDKQFKYCFKFFMHHLCDTKVKGNIYKPAFSLIKRRACVVVHICTPNLPKFWRKSQENQVF